MPTNNAFEIPHQQRGTVNDNLMPDPKYRTSQIAYNNKTRFFIKRHRFLAACIASGGLVCSVLVFLFNRSAVNETIIPIIEAEQGPIKVRPTESSHVVPHSEKTIYDLLAPQEATTRVESLLSQPEKPQSQNPSLPEDFMQSLEILNNEDGATLASNQNTTNDRQPVNDSQQAMLNLINNLEDPSYVDDSGEDTETIADNNELLNINTSPPSTYQSIFLDEAVQQPFVIGPNRQSVSSESQSNQVEMANVKVKSSKIIAPTVNVKQQVAPKITYRAQLGSALTKKAAEQSWQKIYKKAPHLLENYKPVYEKIDLGSKIGIRYRIQVGHFNNESVHKLCQKLKAKGLDCVSVRQNSR